MNYKPQPMSDENAIKILNLIRAGIAACRHHQNYGGRVHNKIRDFIKGSFPTAVCHFGDHEISIWGAGLCDHQQRMFLIWSWPAWDQKPEGWHWSHPILNEAINREDPTDRMERTAMEDKLDVEFSKMELVARELEDRLTALRKQAREVCERLPLPPTAVERKFRDAVHFWDRPTEATAKRYPTLFGT